MRPEPKKRIDTNAAQTSLTTNLGGAFADLPPLESLQVAPLDKSGATALTPEPVWKMGRVVLRREKAHRGGKTVVIIDNFATHLPLSILEAVAKRVRAACGCGGTIKDRRVEIQGDNAAKVRAVLEAEGFQVAGVR